MSHVYSKLLPFYDVASCTYRHVNVLVNSMESQCKRTLSKELKTIQYTFVMRDVEGYS
jgi:hypothetical protein